MVAGIVSILPMAQPPGPFPQYPGPPPPRGQGLPPTPNGGWGPSMWPATGPAPRPGTSGFAVAALVFGIVGGVPLSIIFGFTALNRMRRQPQRGRNLAIAGLTLSGLWTAVVVCSMVVGIANSPSPYGNGSRDVHTLLTGDCVNGLKDNATLTEVETVACTEPHGGEVVGSFKLSEGPWPGDAAADRESHTTCSALMEKYAPKAASDPGADLYYIRPTRESFAQDDREVVCIATYAGGKRTGSLLG